MLPLSKTDTRNETDKMARMARPLVFNIARGTLDVANLLGVSMQDGAYFMRGQYGPEAGTSQFRRIVLFVRLYAALHSLHDSDVDEMKAWVFGIDDEIGATPWSRIVNTESGFESVVEYATDLAQQKIMQPAAMMP